MDGGEGEPALDLEANVLRGPPDPIRFNERMDSRMRRFIITFNVSEDWHVCCMYLIVIYAISSSRH